MAFVGESRIDMQSPWDLFVCLNKSESRYLLAHVEKELKKAEEKLEYYEGLNEAGTITRQQQFRFDRWLEEVDFLRSIKKGINNFFK